MFQKIFLFVFLFFSILWVISAENGDTVLPPVVVTGNPGCVYYEDDEISISDFLEDCTPDGVVTWWTMDLDGWLRDMVLWWITNFSLFLWFIAVWALVYAGLLLQFSGWEDEKISKAKNIFKWTIIGFILLISASGIVYVIINVMFGLWWN